MDTRSTLLDITRENGTFKLAGEIDMSNAAEFSRKVAEGVTDGNRVVFDCTDLRFIDSTGMAALVEMSRRLGASGRLVIRSAPHSLRKAVRVLGLDRLPNVEIDAG
jgi:anti-sigma B factor antagonist